MARLARHSDPETSRSKQAVMFDTTVRERVLNLFRSVGSMTDEQLVYEYTRFYGMTRGSTIRTRRKELVNDGYLRDTGETERLILTGYPAKVWAAA